MVHCGYCTNAEDYENLAIKFDKFADDNVQCRNKMAKNSYDYYQKNFNKDTFIKKIEKMLE